MSTLRILSNMRTWRQSGVKGTSFSLACLACLTAGTLMGYPVQAETCTTQAKMTPQQRMEVGTAAYNLASAVQARDPNRVKSATVAGYAGDPNQTAFLVRTTGEHIGSEALGVTQVYLLDASARKAGDTTEADFSCPLTGTASETDFGISGLPPGQFAFAMVEAQGNNPWLLAFLLQQEGGAWKMAGFYPHPRSAAGHDGLWYWNTARADGKAGKTWRAWLMFGVADQLLRPASFVSTGNLEKLRTEQRSAAPVALQNGLSAESPLTVQGQGGAVYRLIELRAQPSDDAKLLNLFLRLQPEAAPAGADAAAEKNLDAARALLTAHPEFRDGFSNVYVVRDGNGGVPITAQRSIQDLMADRK